MTQSLRHVKWTQVYESEVSKSNLSLQMIGKLRDLSLFGYPNLIGNTLDSLTIHDMSPALTRITLLRVL